MSNRVTDSLRRFWKFLVAKGCLLHSVLMALFLILCVILLSWWLSVYTHHGQQLILPDYEGMDLEEAIDDAHNKTFEIVVTDSVHQVSVAGGQIIKQNPEPQSKVKENRKIYVTVTKYSPDKILVSKLPVLYGENYERKKRELEMGFELKSRIGGYVFDSGPQGHILEVRYNGDAIISRSGIKGHVQLDKGATLEFILSQSHSGALNVPDLLCMKYDAAVQTAWTYKIGLKVEQEEGLRRVEDGYVAIQSPEADDGRTINLGDSILVYLTRELPSYCQNNQ